MHFSKQVLTDGHYKTGKFFLLTIEKSNIYQISEFLFGKICMVPNVVPPSLQTFLSPSHGTFPRNKASMDKFCKFFRLLDIMLSKTINLLRSFFDWNIINPIGKRYYFMNKKKVKIDYILSLQNFLRKKNIHITLES